MKKIKLAVIFLGFAVLSTPVFADDSADSASAPAVPEVRSVSGIISELDFVGSKVTINVNETQITFSVSEKTKIFRGPKAIGFVDLAENDPLTVEYFESEPLVFQAVAISDNNLDLGDDTNT
jgi:hypothetical protein